MPEPTAPWSIELGSGLGPVPLRTSTGTQKQPNTSIAQNLVAEWMARAPSLLHNQTSANVNEVWALAQPHLMPICLLRLRKLSKGLEVSKCMPLSTGGAMRNDLVMRREHPGHAELIWDGPAIGKLLRLLIPCVQTPPFYSRRSNNEYGSPKASKFHAQQL